MGNILADMGTVTAAIVAYDRSIELDPNYSSPWNGKGKALEILGNSSAANAAYDMASALDPTTGQRDRDRASQTTQAGGYPLAVSAVVVGTVILAAGRRNRRDPPRIG